jgi:hypothetical protein
MAEAVEGGFPRVGSDGGTLQVSAEPRITVLSSRSGKPVIPRFPAEILGFWLR